MGKPPFCVCLCVPSLSSCPEGGGPEEKTAAVHWPVQVPPQLPQPLLRPVRVNPLCPHQSGEAPLEPAANRNAGGGAK